MDNLSCGIATSRFIVRDSLPHSSEVIQRYFAPLRHFQRQPLVDSDPSLKMDGMHRNQWTASSGISGRHQSESVVDIKSESLVGMLRNTHLTFFLHFLYGSSTFGRYIL